MSYQHALEEGLHQLGCDISPDILLQYLQLLHKWNQTYNLTAVRDMKAMVNLHILDSLAIFPWIKGPFLLDVGSGPGLPGIPLAIAQPNLKVVLLDSNGKKTRFLQEAKRILSLDNVDIVQTRVENYHPSHGFDTVTSRAFSELDQMVHWTHHLVAKDGVWVAMKGRYPEAELAKLHQPYQVKTYTVPGIDGERCCVVVENQQEKGNVGNNHGKNNSRC